MNLFWRQYCTQKSHIEDAPNIFWSPWKRMYIHGLSLICKHSFWWLKISPWKSCLKCLDFVKLGLWTLREVRKVVWYRNNSSRMNLRLIGKNRFSASFFVICGYPRPYSRKFKGHFSQWKTNKYRWKKETKIMFLEES